MLPKGAKASIVLFVACCCFLQFHWKNSTSVHLYCAEWLYADSHYTDCRYAGCRGASELYFFPVIKIKRILNIFSSELLKFEDECEQMKRLMKAPQHFVKIERAE